MLRKLTIALAATAAIGLAFVATEASAKGMGHGPGMHGPGMHGGHGFRGLHGRFFGPGFGWGYYPSYAYGDDYACYQARRVATPYGWRWRRVWICG